MNDHMTSIPEPKTPSEALGRDLKVAATEAYNLFIASHHSLAGRDLPDEERTRLQGELAELMRAAIKKVMGESPRDVLEECFAHVWTRQAIDEIQTRIDQKALLDTFREGLESLRTLGQPKETFQEADRKDGRTKKQPKGKYAKPSKGRKRKTVA